ncbi:MAG: hypothetical protein M1830_004475 [Pleopsidium flavum]|nr:MAG: hypothetical protein M1830_004475 [Pleopsidium flavum]
MSLPDMSSSTSAQPATQGPPTALDLFIPPDLLAALPSYLRRFVPVTQAFLTTATRFAAEVEQEWVPEFRLRLDPGRVDDRRSKWMAKYGELIVEMLRIDASFTRARTWARESIWVRGRWETMIRFNAWAYKAYRSLEVYKDRIEENITAIDGWEEQEQE